MKKLINYPEVDVDNMQLMIDYLITNYEHIKDNFNMRIFRGIKDNQEHECNTYGCLLGWGIGGLDKKSVESYIFSNKIDYDLLSSELLGVETDLNLEWNLWDYLFSYKWGLINNQNTLEAGINRIKTVLDDIDYKSTPEWKL